jgi:hypothetical protein
MAQTISGQVTSKSRKGTGIQIDKGEWINGTFDQLKDINWKDMVEVEVDGKQIKSIKRVAGAPAAAPPTQVGGYNDRQEAIEWQSARRDAITIVACLVENGIAALPAAKADKQDAVVALVDKIAVELFRREVPNRKVEEADEG